mgnify:FL=1
METCKTCQLWRPVVGEFYNKEASNGGICKSGKITEEIGGYAPDRLVYPYDEGGYFWTGPDFGCVHHKDA